MSNSQIKREPLPEWLKRPIGKKGVRDEVVETLRSSSLNTVCEEAKCPNRSECFSCGTATFLVMGDVCTRDCLFCSVGSGSPLPLDLEEPDRILAAVKKMKLSYVVITSVTRDDLTDGGSSHIAKIVELLKRSIPEIRVEVLVPDFGGDESSLLNVLEAQPDVFNHNIETVRSVFTRIRPQANYDQSLKVLQFAAQKSTIQIKTGFMVGLGESELEVRRLIQDVYDAGVSVLTIGQYLRPSLRQEPVVEYISPEKFRLYESYANEIGIAHVYSGPFVRSSYRAAEVFSAS